MSPTRVSRLDPRQQNFHFGCSAQQVLNSLSIPVQGFLTNLPYPFLKESGAGLEIDLYEIPEPVFLNPSTECGKSAAVGVRRADGMNLRWTLIISPSGSQCESPADDSLGLLLRFRIVTHEYHLSDELVDLLDRSSRPGGMDSRKRFTVIFETTTPRHFKRDWMVERLSPLARMSMIGSTNAM